VHLVGFIIRMYRPLYRSSFRNLTNTGSRSSAFPFSQFPSYFFTLGPKHLLQHPILQYTQRVILIWQTDVHTHTKQQAKLWFCFTLFSWIAHRMTEDSRPNCNRHSLNLMCPSFPHAWNSDLSLSFLHTFNAVPHIWVLPHFQRTY
jgi:hypothetical protein